VSIRKTEINKAKSLLRQIYRIEHGEVCQICLRRKAKRLGLFHIMNVGAYPRLELFRENILWACWYPCHNTWHQDFWKARRIADRIAQIKGRQTWEEVEQELQIANGIIGPLKLIHIQVIQEKWREELKILRGKI